ncbi:MAG: PilT/PilU family type 4a pilus ATPase [Candidatus Eisenbacteria bacterium]|uniref:PilT/PilU family type 4a pilus ATPase n=1 Tax=Eiseniibacteriota bacterium TaxID=2212470 RepID=A0A937X7M5_UNCEI|nr:PilT/PilU family type 4a pilus ATPase [Candidatus Eisenbacteria bacterium]
MDIGAILEEAVRRQASDVLLSAGAPPTYHVFGRLERHEPAEPLTPAQSQRLAYDVMNEEQRKLFEQNWELDLGFQYRELARFRASVYRQRGTVAAVLRLIPLRIPRYPEIGISEQLMVRLLGIPNGLVLVTGPTGAGKSTTVASYLHYLNTEHGVPRHIITIEDPIEFLLPSQGCVIDQRELGIDTKNYVIGLRSALRQMPHVIFVGEMRDRATMEIALTAAETGNLVISTLATQSASKTIHRIIDVFPVDHQAEIRARLALGLRAVFSQVLLRRADGRGRIAAREVLFATSAVANLIREGKIHLLNNVIASGASEGMALLDDSLLELYRQKLIGKADVISRLEDPQKAKRILS